MSMYSHVFDFFRNKILICILFFKSLERVLSISDRECIKVCRSTTYQAKVIERLFLINNINPKKIKDKDVFTQTKIYVFTFAKTKQLFIFQCTYLSGFLIGYQLAQRN